GGRDRSPRGSGARRAAARAAQAPPSLGRRERLRAEPAATAAEFRSALAAGAAPSPPPSADGSRTVSSPSPSYVATVRATGSYVVAGTVMAPFGAFAVVLMPLRVSLVDRHGPRRALPPMTAPHAVPLGAPADVTWRPGAQPVVLGARAALAGACAPSARSRHGAGGGGGGGDGG
ncbi:hypothetical protein ACFU6H_18115, partial [Streptomyces phaeoluteigriseus]